MNEHDNDGDLGVECAYLPALEWESTYRRPCAAEPAPRRRWREAAFIGVVAAVFVFAVCLTVIGWWHSLSV
jgi:hypothetical protein